MSLFKRAAFGAAISATPLAAVADTYGKYQSPPYQVDAVLNAVELRSYAPHILAEVTVQGDRSAALNAGFRVLAGYIFGGNTAQASVAMTSPVAQSQTIDMTSPVAQSGSGDQWVVSFMMPRDWTIDSLPRPNTPAIRFVQTPPEQRAVLRFSGRATTAALARAETTLRDTLAQNGIAATGPAAFYYYDDPMTLPWNRRNEVALTLVSD